MTQVIINDVALAELAGAIDSGAFFSSAETANLANDNGDLVEQLRGALTTRCVQFANRAAGSDNRAWRTAMALLVDELVGLASVMAGSLAAASGEPFSPGKIGWSAYLAAAQQRAWWDRPERPAGEIIDQWSRAFAIAQRGDGSPASAGDAIEASMLDVGLDPVVEIQQIFPGDRIILMGPDGEPREAGVFERAEAQYWREHQACELDELLRALEQRKAPKDFLVQRLANAYAGLKDAMSGQFYERCEGCGRQIWPGEVEIPCTDVRLHADCSGKLEIKAGDQVKVGAESIEQEEGQEPRDYVVAFMAEHLFTQEQIRERLVRAHEVLAKMGRI